jgi:hypothetical protein
VLGAEPECATNYHADGKSAQTFVLTSLTPQTVIERLPGLLVAEGVAMDTSQPEKGILNAEGLDVKAETAGDATRVTFRSSVGANQALLCRYAGLVGNPPKPRKARPPQDPALIAKLKNDLIRKHQIVENDKGRGLNHAELESEEVFLEFEIEDLKQVDDTKFEYDLSMLLPAAACLISKEDSGLASNGFIGKDTPQRTKPVRVAATMIYTKTGSSSRLTDAFITRIESVK